MLMWGIEQYINNEESDILFDPVPAILRKDMRFIIDLLTLNALNEDDRKIMTIDDGKCIYIQFNGEKSYMVTHGVYNEVDSLDDEPPIKKILMYQLWLKGSLKNVRENVELAEVVEEWHVICAIVLERFTEMEENLQWEPKVAVIGKRLLKKHINQLLTAEQFTIKILSDIFYRGYGEYYFKQRMID
jgi:hypothetical protein